MRQDEKSYLLALLRTTRKKLNKQLDLCHNPESFNDLLDTLNILDDTYNTIISIDTKEE